MKRYQVFLSSTYTDLIYERGLIFNTLMKMNHIPAGMELFPALDEEQSRFIKRVIEDSDYYILLLGGRYGSLNAEGLSYTELEFDYAVEKGLRVIALIHGKPDDIALGKSEKDPILRQRLDNFRERVQNGRLVNFWESATDLPALVALSLTTTIASYPANGWVRGSEVGSVEALSEINRLNNLVGELSSALDLAARQIASLSATPMLENLASLDSKIRVHGTYISNYQGSTNTWNQEMTWSELFAEIAPSLIEHPNDSLVKDMFAKVLFDKVSAAAKLPSGRSPRLDQRFFETMRIQLVALKLVSVERSKTVGGGVGLFWELTDVGRRLMFDLRTIRNETAT